MLDHNQTYSHRVINKRFCVEEYWSYIKQPGCASTYSGLKNISLLQNHQKFDKGHLPVMLKKDKKDVLPEITMVKKKSINEYNYRSFGLASQKQCTQAILLYFSTKS